MSFESPKYAVGDKLKLFNVSAEKANVFPYVTIKENLGGQKLIVNAIDSTTNED